jgi:uncharacterized protein (TIGR02145 family)
MSRFKGSLVARLVAVPAVAIFLSLVLVGCMDDGNPDNDNYTYNGRTVTIGTQTWMAENLNRRTADSWCWSDDAANCNTYGRLYTWDAARTACPAGWHLPSRDEWEVLEDFVGGSSIAGTILKTSDWGGTNDYNFSALPHGHRTANGTFFGLGSDGDWWTATGYDVSSAYGLGMAASRAYVYDSYGGPVSKGYGFAVRCVQD